MGKRIRVYCQLKEKFVIEIFTEGSIRLPFKNIRKTALKKIAEGAINHLGLSDIIITMIFTDNEFIREINSKYRNKNNPTDVISFAYRENPFPEAGAVMENLGDIYISLEKAEEQADKNSLQLIDETARLIIHGILHLLGYDHETSEPDAAAMKKIEDEIFDMARSGKP